MELRNFIKEALYQIAWGTSDAQKDLPPNSRVAPKGIFPFSISQTPGFFDKRTEEPITIVDFDVAISTKEDSETKGGAGIFVVGIGLGGQGQSNSSAATVSRIKFSVPVHLPPS